ncbi:ABC transporter ATP-binding protein [Dictyobacter formicarum]|uniref:Multidrug ABC transporter permease n=1 Tax=Dictyobacter formicarum TaxID=2778368 RepID=A0ABQ3VU28_9CHLR|nr:ABC transporter ATP-binding protein [Dictyobacter formicarum]GHO89241.1 multidrug ABC transporter permease [Dictyobacter formicarum]
MKKMSRSLATVIQDLSTLRRGLALLFTAAPLAAICYLGFILTDGLAPVLQVWLLKLVVDSLTGTPAQPARTMLYAGCYAATLIVPGLQQATEGMLISSLQRRAAATIDRHIMQAASRLVDLQKVEGPGFQDEARLLQEALQPLYWTWVRIRNGSRMTIALLGLLLLLARLQPLFPLLLLLASIPHLLAERRGNQAMWQSMADRSRPAREMDMYVGLLTEPTAAKEIRVFGLGDFFLRRFQARAEQALRELTRLRLAEIRYALLCGGLYILVLGGGFWYVAAQTAAGHLTLGDVALYLNSVIQAQGRLAIIAAAGGELYSSILWMRRLFTFADQAQPAIPLANPGLSAPATPQTGIQLQQVSFSYAEQAAPVLHEIYALLPAGKLTALIGVNGAGKSTLVKLLARLYDPGSGAILLDGQDLRTYELDSLRGQLATVPQDFAHFALTLRENISIGGLNSKQQPLSVEEAAHWSGADEVACKLPDGYDTPLTRRFDGGSELSGGEWQKIALARSFIRQAPLLILDEPSSALDADAEHQLFERIKTLAKGKTALMISHRLSTVRQADQILVLDRQRIVESGTHDQLLATGGHYATLYEMQAGRYRDKPERREFP